MSLSLQCGKPYQPGDEIVINGTEADVTLLRERMLEKRARAKAEKVCAILFESESLLPFPFYFSSAPQICNLLLIHLPYIPHSLFISLECDGSYIHVIINITILNNLLGVSMMSVLHGGGG